MGIDEIMSDGLGRTSQVSWEIRDQRSAEKVVRETITNYFLTCPKYNTPSVFVRYELGQQGLGFLDRLLRRTPVFEDLIHQGTDGTFQILPWGGKRKSHTNSTDRYLAHVERAYVTFMFGSHHNGNMVIDEQGGSTRIGIVRTRE